MRKLARYALFLLPVLFWLPHLADIPIPAGSPYTDLLISHYPNALFLQQAIFKLGTIPLWSPLILGGYPFAADPLSGLFYPPGWLSLLFPVLFGINLVLVLHFIWGGVGMYLFLRDQGVREGPAIFGALSFEAMPKLFAHLGAGHITLIYAVSWTPWLLWVERVTGREWWSKKKGVRWILPGSLLGVIALADIRWAAYAGLGWLAYLLLNEGFRYRRTFGQWGEVVGRGLSNVLTAGLVCSPLLLPLLEYSRLSTRSQMTTGEALTLSLPPAQWLGLAYPYLRGPAEWMLYPGAMGLVLFLLAVSSKKMWVKTRFWIGMILVTLVAAVGSFLPPLGIIYQLPGMDLLRVPPRILFLTGLAFAVVGAYVLDDLFSSASEEHAPGPDKVSGLVLFGAAGFIGLLGLAVVLLIQNGPVQVQFGWGACLFSLSTGLLLMGRKKILTAKWLFVLILILQMVDLNGVNILGLEFLPLQNQINVSGEAAAFISTQGGQPLFRVYSPSYSIPQDAGAVYGLELADGVDPLQLKNYSLFMTSATGVPSTGYSVTLPPFMNGDPAVDNRAYHPNSKQLGLLNVRFVASEFNLAENGLVLIKQFGNKRIYENQESLPRAWVQDSNSPAGQNIRPVKSIQENLNQVNIQGEGPGLLVLADVDYPGWQVEVDGISAQKLTVAGILRGVELAGGEHTIRFVFRPFSVYAGWTIGGITWFCLFVLLGVNFNQMRQDAR